MVESNLATELSTLNAYQNNVLNSALLKNVRVLLTTWHRFAVRVAQLPSLLSGITPSLFTALGVLSLLSSKHLMMVEMVYTRFFLK